MSTYVVRYMYLDPQAETLESDSACDAAAAFLDHHGGRGQGNYGRCVIVTDQGGNETRWAFIRTGATSGQLEPISYDD